MTTQTDATYTAEEVTAHRAAWLAALRSGDYAQATGALRIENTYCCLGVVEEVRGANWRHVDSLRDEDEEDDHAVDDGTHGVPDVHDTYAFTTLSRDAQRWLGVVNDNPYVCYRPAGTTERWYLSELVALNDDGRLTLAAIADVVADQRADWDGSRERVQADVDARNARRDEEER
jgi:hypothetical protein